MIYSHGRTRRRTVNSCQGPWDAPGVSLSPPSFEVMNYTTHPQISSPPAEKSHEIPMRNLRNRNPMMHTRRLFPILLIALLLPLRSFCQDVPYQLSKGFAFAGYAVNTNRAPISATLVDVKFTLYAEGEDGFTETHTGIQTDDFGIFHTVIGMVDQAGFSRLSFSEDNYYLRVEVREDGTVDYSEISDEVLGSVPYSLSAENEVPPGFVVAFGGPASAIPPGWLECDGRLLDAGQGSQYDRLFQAIGTLYGGAPNQFRIPDLRGRFIRGVDNSAGRDQSLDTRVAIGTGGDGDAVATFQSSDFGGHSHAPDGINTSEVGSHTHTLRGRFAGDIYDGQDQVVMLNEDYPAVFRGKDTEGAGNHTHTLNGRTNFNGSLNEANPLNVYAFFIIKY